MNILLVDNHTKHREELQKLLKDFDVNVCDNKEFLDYVRSSDVVFFSGGSGIRSVKNHKEDYQKEIEFIRGTDKKVIGICLGCEIIATAFDCSLRELKVKEEGIVNIDFGSKKVSVYEAHRFAIENVSNEIEIVATSEHGIEMIKHKTKSIFGLQFHPEMFVDRTQGDEIVLEILNDRNRR